MLGSSGLSQHASCTDDHKRYFLCFICTFFLLIGRVMLAQNSFEITSQFTSKCYSCLAPSVLPRLDLIAMWLEIHPVWLGSNKVTSQNEQETDFPNGASVSTFISPSFFHQHRGLGNLPQVLLSCYGSTNEKMPRVSGRKGFILFPQICKFSKFSTRIDFVLTNCYPTTVII